MKSFVSWPQGSIRARLFVLVLVLALPLQVLIIGAVWQMARLARDAQEGGVSYMAQTIRNGLDAHLQRYIVIGEGLAKSPSLLADDMVDFRREAERFFPDTSEAWALVADEHAYVLMNLLFPADEPPSKRSEQSTAAQIRAQDTGQTMVTGIFRGLASEDWVASIEIPVGHNTSPFRALAIPFRAKTVLRLLTSRDIPEGYLVGVIDKEGRFVARTTQHEQTVGQLASEGWRTTIAKEGIFEFSSLEGEPLLQANAVSSISEWTVGVAVKKSIIDAQVNSTVRFALLFGGTISFITLLVAAAIAKGISDPIRKFASTASAVVREGGTASTDSGSFTSLPELREVWLALTRAVRDRDQYDFALRHQLGESVAAEKRQRLLLGELAHRVKNTLAVVQSMAFLTFRSTADPKVFVDVFSARLAALGRAHSLLVNGAWAGAKVQNIVEAAVSPFRNSKDDRIQLAGPEVEISPTATISLSLMLHELATNAVKHGALRTPEGHVSVWWERLDAEKPPRLELHWVEKGNPTIKKPTTEGFGSRLLTSSAAQLRGDVRIDYRPEGLDCCIRFPLHLDNLPELPDIEAPAGPESKQTPMRAEGQSAAAVRVKYRT
jgi:two-component sensor histidine kinase